MPRYIARGPVTVIGRDYRSGDTFEADPAAVANAINAGLAEALEPLETKPSRKGKSDPAE